MQGARPSKTWGTVTVQETEQFEWCTTFQICRESEQFERRIEVHLSSCS
jgi:hypothetical protein